MSTKFRNKDIIACMPDKSIPLVSVGSGMGKREQELCKYYDTVICIDPRKEDFVDKWTNITRVMNPDYGTVYDLIKARPEIRYNCYLLIEYPLTDYVTYDFFSMYDLQPVNAVILTSKSGGSGGMLLHMWLRLCRVETQNKIKTCNLYNLVMQPTIDYTLELVREYRTKANEDKVSQDMIFVNCVRNSVVKTKCILSPKAEDSMPKSANIDALNHSFKKCLMCLNIINS